MGWGRLCDDFGRRGRGGRRHKRGHCFIVYIEYVPFLPFAGPRGTSHFYTHLSLSRSLYLPPLLHVSLSLRVAACLPPRYIWTNITWHVMPTQRHSCTPNSSIVNFLTSKTPHAPRLVPLDCTRLHYWANKVLWLDGWTERDKYLYFKGIEGGSCR